MTADEIRDKVMQMESEDVRNELAELCVIVSRLEASTAKSARTLLRSGMTIRGGGK